MNPHLNYTMAQERSAERQHAGEQTGLVREAGAGWRKLPDPRFTLHGHHVAKLDRFVGQAQRAALRAEREFEGVSIKVDAQGLLSVHAIGMTSMLL